MPAKVSSPPLFTAIDLGQLKLSHRIVMGPLTRFRADPKTQAQTLLGKSHAEYYAQRATPGGLLISEAIQVSPAAAGYRRAPGLWTEAQIESWKPITQAVHQAGGHIFAQLWALGRAAPPTYEVFGKTYARKSASATSFDDSSAAIPLTVQEIKMLVTDFARAARSAVDLAGFDGIEIHSANGYLPDQFLQASSNKRTDDYGGTLANRFRFPLAIVEACSAAIGPERVGIRLSPFSTFQGMGLEPDPMAVFVPFVETLLQRVPKLAYVHVVESRIIGSTDATEAEARSIAPMRTAVSNCSHGFTRFISAGGYTPTTALEAAEKNGDLIVFGRFFISNPDLVKRVRKRQPLSPYNRDTFYTSTTAGYTDYPTYQAAHL
ncbi:hypothetical protein CROQUDRAFT_37517 [Cronartium quercuum f. sp. fusiforme G11]|uniref:NADH:flavin oxidoreductase/NADH oxidase N-terminal domain-containing protein n=1 Tax=Cronartium quercuum f. sp. fusiforme G11 TaxID=708437 RepID=A0A9P6NSJ3_9BASI|nr:hypothetical protein CROQUDRAFT_37517 [Cronartium quercuum f. sp. fusiforme G11]